MHMKAPSIKTDVKKMVSLQTLQKHKAIEREREREKESFSESIIIWLGFTETPLLNVITSQQNRFTSSTMRRWLQVDAL